MRLLLLSGLLLLAGRCSVAWLLRGSEAQQGAQQGAQKGAQKGARQGVQKGVQQGVQGAQQGVQGAQQGVQEAQQGVQGARQGVQQGVQGLSDGRSALQLGRGSRTRAEDGGALCRARSPQGPEGNPRDPRQKKRFLKHLTGPLHFSPKCRKHFHRLYHHTRDCTTPAYYKRCALLMTRLANSPRCRDR